MSSLVVLSLTGPMDHLRLVWQTGETLLQSVVFDDDPEGNRYNVLVALQEMVTNVLRHGYRLDDDTAVAMAAADAYLTPTLCVSQPRSADFMRAHGFQPWAIDLALATGIEHRVMRFTL